jgi:O-antigen/teichoic acid export membrane protein
MRLKTLISTSLLYGVADMAVLLVSGFILLPLYTRTLSKADFGIYVVVRANTELLSYLLYLGVPSAMARLYFDHRRTGDHYDYVGTIVIAFTATALVGTALTFLVGDHIWAILAPLTPGWPYLWFCFGTATISFYGLTGLTWLRLDEAIRLVVAIQVATALLLALFAWVALATFDTGLNGLLSVLLFANIPPAVVLLGRLIGRFNRPLPIATIRATLILGMPIFLSYLSNFALNRINLFIMQHWVNIERIAVYGLAVQLASLVTVTSMSFSKAVQPIIFSADTEEIGTILNRATPVYIGVMTLAAASFTLFLDDLMTIIAPESYGAAYDIVLLLTVANLISAFSLISDTTLMYFKKPQISLLVMTAGGIASTLVGLALVPLWQAMGAATALIVAFSLKTLGSQFIANRYVATNTIGLMVTAVAGVVVFIVLVRWFHGLALPFWMSVTVKVAILAALSLAGGGRLLTLRHGRARTAIL